MFASIFVSLVWGLAETPQAKDCILIDGERVPIREVPLTRDAFPKREFPKFDIQSTANWKGYECSWQLRNSKLYLIEFKARRDDKPVDPKSVFGAALPLEATWFTGKVSVMYDLPSQWELGTGKQYRSRLLLIKKGRLVISRRGTITAGFSWGEPGFEVERRNGLLVVAKVQTAAPAAGAIEVGDVLIGVLDSNGFSLTFSDEPMDVVNAVLHGDTKTEFTAVIKRQDDDGKPRAALVTRYDPLEEQFREMLRDKNSAKQ